MPRPPSHRGADFSMTRTREEIIEEMLKQSHQQVSAHTGESSAPDWATPIGAMLGHGGTKMASPQETAHAFSRQRKRHAAPAAGIGSGNSVTRVGLHYAGNYWQTV